MNPECWQAKQETDENAGEAVNQYLQRFQNALQHLSHNQNVKKTSRNQGQNQGQSQNHKHQQNVKKTSRNQGQNQGQSQNHKHQQRERQTDLEISCRLRHPRHIETSLGGGTSSRLHPTGHPQIPPQHYLIHEANDNLAILQTRHRL